MKRFLAVPLLAQLPTLALLATAATGYGMTSAHLYQGAEAHLRPAATGFRAVTIPPAPRPNDPPRPKQPCS